MVKLIEQLRIALLLVAPFVLSEISRARVRLSMFSMSFFMCLQSEVRTDGFTSKNWIIRFKCIPKRQCEVQGTQGRSL